MNNEGFWRTLWQDVKTCHIEFTKKFAFDCWRNTDSVSFIAALTDPWAADAEQQLSIKRAVAEAAMEKGEATKSLFSPHSRKTEEAMTHLKPGCCWGIWDEIWYASEQELLFKRWKWTKIRCITIHLSICSNIDEKSAEPQHPSDRGHLATKGSTESSATRHQTDFNQNNQTPTDVLVTAETTFKKRGRHRVSLFLMIKQEHDLILRLKTTHPIVSMLFHLKWSPFLCLLSLVSPLCASPAHGCISFYFISFWLWSFSNFYVFCCCFF